METIWNKAVDSTILQADRLKFEHQRRGHMQFVDLFLRAANALAAPSGEHRRLPIIFYHRVLERSDPLRPDTPDSRLFDIHMGTLARVFKVIGLDDGLARLSAGTLPARALCISFDDGYRDNPEVALPILRKHGLVATFFVASGFLGNGRLFVDTVIEVIRRLPDGPVDLQWFGLGIQQISDDASRLALIDKLVADIKYRDLDSRQEALERVAALVDTRLPDDLMMSPEQLRSMHRAGMSIGGHTVDHPILASVSPEEARRQLVFDRQAIAAITGVPPTLFAYPNGRLGRDFTAAHVQMVRESGYVGAVTTDVGCASAASDPLLLPRQSPWQRSPLRLVAGITRSTRSKSSGRLPQALTPAGA